MEETGAQLMLLLPAPSRHNGEFGCGEQYQLVDKSEQLLIIIGKGIVYELSPNTVWIAAPFQLIHRYCQLIGCLRERSDAPSLEEDDVDGALHLRPLG